MMMMFEKKTGRRCFMFSVFFFYQFQGGLCQVTMGSRTRNIAHMEICPSASSGFRPRIKRSTFPFCINSLFSFFVRRTSYFPSFFLIFSNAKWGKKNNR